MPTRTVEQVTFFMNLDMEASKLHPVAGGTAAVFSTRCPGKETQNEDSAALLLCDGRRGVLAVADGFGGQPAGDQAAQLALAAVADAVATAVAESRSLRTGILDGFERANTAVMGLGVGAATTLAVVEIDDGRVRPYHVGDSMILVLGQRGRVKLQTISHSPVGYALEAGWIEEGDALHHEDRHIVSNMVGAADMRIDIGSLLRLAPRDTVVIGSDGLFDNLHLDEIIELVRRGPLPDALAALASACHTRMRAAPEGLPSKPDDLTIIAYRPGSVGKPAGQDDAT